MFCYCDLFAIRSAAVAVILCLGAQTLVALMEMEARSSGRRDASSSRVVAAQLSASAGKPLADAEPSQARKKRASFRDSASASRV